MDTFNGFTIDVQLTGPTFSPAMGNGNPTSISNLMNFPILDVMGNNEVQVDTLKECGGGTCIPNLILKFVNVTFE